MELSWGSSTIYHFQCKPGLTAAQCPSDLWCETNCLHPGTPNCPANICEPVPGTVNLLAASGAYGASSSSSSSSSRGASGDLLGGRVGEFDFGVPTAAQSSGAEFGIVLGIGSPTAAGGCVASREAPEACGADVQLGPAVTTNTSSSSGGGGGGVQRLEVSSLRAHTSYNFFVRNYGQRRGTEGVVDARGQRLAMRLTLVDAATGLPLHNEPLYRAPAAAAANYGNPSLAHFPRGPRYSPASEYARIFCLSTGAPAAGDGDGDGGDGGGGGGGGGGAVATPHNCAEYFSAKAQFYVAGLETCPPARSACAAQGKSAGFHCTRQLFSGFAKPDSGFYACPGGYQQLQQCPATTECRETAPGSVSCVRGR